MNLETAAAAGEYVLEISGPDCVIGDVDGDGDVDLADVAALAGALGTCWGDPQYDHTTDFDGSGCVDLADVAAFQCSFGSGS
jgi:hypothetical protein